MLRYLRKKDANVCLKNSKLPSKSGIDKINIEVESFLCTFFLKLFSLCFTLFFIANNLQIMNEKIKIKTINLHDTI